MEHDAAAGRTGPGAAPAGTPAPAVALSWADVSDAALGLASCPSAAPRSSRAEHTPQALEADHGDLAVAPAGHGAPRADQGLPVLDLHRCGPHRPIPDRP